MVAQSLNRPRNLPKCKKNKHFMHKSLFLKDLAAEPR